MQVVLLNADYSPLGVIDWRKAVKLIVKKKVEVIKLSKKIITNVDNIYKIIVPEIIRLIKLIRSIWKARVPFNRRTVIIRDNHTCAYCLVKKHDMTIDHVIPRSKGGKSTFDNVVCCCKPCNHKKDDRLPSEAGMYLKFKPTTPTIMEFIVRQIKNVGMNETLQTLEELGVI